MHVEASLCSLRECLEPEAFAPNSEHAADTVVPTEAENAVHAGSVMSDLDENGSMADSSGESMSVLVERPLTGAIAETEDEAARPVEKWAPAVERHALQPRRRVGQKGPRDRLGK